MNPEKNQKAKLLIQLANRAPTGPIVEIGCIRNSKEVIEDGFSTPYLAGLAQCSNRTFHSFDISPICVEIANKVLINYKLPPLVKCKDGVEALRDFPDYISFLFLDSHKHPEFSFRQLIQAQLLPGAIVAVDDAQKIDEFAFGKAHFIKQVLDLKQYPYILVDTYKIWKTLWLSYPNGKERGKIL